MNARSGADGTDSTVRQGRSVSAPMPGLPEPAQRVMPDERPLLLAYILGFPVVIFLIVALGAQAMGDGPPYGGWSSLWPAVPGLAVVGLFCWWVVPGEVRAGPGWIAQQWRVRWQAVTLNTLSGVELKVQSAVATNPSLGVVVSLIGRNGQHVDLTFRALDKRPIAAGATLAMLEEAGRRSVPIDPMVLVAFQALGHPVSATAGGREVPANLVEASTRNFDRARRRYRLLALTVRVAGFIGLAVLALVALVRLLGFH
ncbi:MAG: hypothetical protein J2P57_02455 [Acidimicrobiaceae bacterium]|nr:hypothetical protein [Acidimicrobiaceae bacterium]